MVERRPSRPAPWPSGRERARCFTRSSGLRRVTRGLKGVPLGEAGRVPVCFWEAAWSAVEMKGMMRDLTASMSWGELVR